VAASVVNAGADLALAGDDLLFSAARTSDIEIVNAILAAGIDVNSTTDSGDSALHYACSHGDIDVVRRLLQIPGVNVNIARDDGETPLISAVQENFEGSLEIVRLLIAHGADVNATTNVGTTSLFVAAEFGDLLIVRELIAAQATVSAVRGDGDFALCVAAQNGWTEIVRELLDAGACAKQIRPDGVSPAYAASEWNHIDIVRLLKSRGADLCAKTASGWYPFLVAADRRHLQLMQALVELGAELHDIVTINGKQQTPTTLLPEALHEHIWRNGTQGFEWPRQRSKNRYDGI
jgi:ankyrin repeat protein